MTYSGNFEHDPRDDEKPKKRSFTSRVKDRAQEIAQREVGAAGDWERYEEQAKGEITWEGFEAWQVSQGWKFDDKYNYTTPDHKLLFESRRYNFVAFPSTKKFILRHREGDKWVHGAGPVRLPYNLTALLANPDRDIELVEGEKGVEALKSLGLLAACVQGQNWTDAGAQFFANRRVNIAMDNDDAGRKNRKTALEWLRKFGAIVRVVELPDLGPRQGLDDWLADHSVAQYQEIVASTPVAGITIKASLFDWIDPKTIPLRDWLLPPAYIRKHTSATIATGGTGKSFKLIADALAMASGKPLLNMQPKGKLRVWYFNGEDPMEELERRFMAAIKYHELQPGDIEDRLFIDSGRRMPIKIASDSRRDGLIIAEPVIREVMATLIENKIDVLMIDPFVSSHGVNENDNMAIDTVAKSWGFISDEANCSIMLSHHSRKPGGEAVTVEASRGASALIDAVRFAQALNTMTAAEADKVSIPESERRSFLSAHNGKSTHAKPASKRDWYKLESVNLENGPTLEQSDDVGVIVPWEYPVDVKAITPDQIKQIQSVLKAGGPWRADSQTKVQKWVGEPIATVLGYPPSLTPAEKKNVSELVHEGLRAGWLKKVEGQDPNRKPRTYVEAGAEPVVQFTAPPDFLLAIHNPPERDTSATLPEKMPENAKSEKPSTHMKKRHLKRVSRSKTRRQKTSDGGQAK